MRQASKQTTSKAATRSKRHPSSNSRKANSPRTGDTTASKPKTSRGRRPVRLSGTNRPTDQKTNRLGGDIAANLRSHWRSVSGRKQDELIARCTDLIHPATDAPIWSYSKFASLCSDLCLAGWEVVRLCAAFKLSDLPTFVAAGHALFELFYQFSQEKMRDALRSDAVIPPAKVKEGKHASSV